MAIPRRTSGGGSGQDMLYLLLFWIAAYFSALLAEKSHLSPLLFYLLFGCIFINCNIIENTPFLDGLAEVAITIVFFALGFEENVKNFLGGIRKAWGIASIGALVPFGCGFGCAALFFPEEGIKPHLMCGLAFTATAVSLTMITLKNEGLAVSRAAIGIMTSAVLDDVAALALVAIMVPIATGAAEPTVLGIGLILAKSLLFFAAIIVFNMFVFPHDLSNMPIIKHVPLVRSIGVHHLLRFHGGEQAVIASLVIGFGIGHMATAFDFHPAIGAYMAGLILEERYYDLAPNQEEQHPLVIHAPDEKGENVADILENAHGHAHAQNVYHHVADILENVAFCWVGPIFFLHLGAQIKIEVDVLKNVIVQSLVIFVCLFFGQISSAAFAARYVPGGFTLRESMMIGFGMLGRAELFFVVLNICYIENNIFSTEMFFAATFAAMLLNISVPITISLYKPYYTGDKNCFLLGPPLETKEPVDLSAGGDAADPVVSPDVLEIAWLQQKATKRTSQQARRVSLTGVDLGLANPSGGRVSVRISKGEGVAAGPVLEVSEKIFSKGCGLPCNKKVCVLCKYIRVDGAASSSALGATPSAPMDNGRPTQDIALDRTISEPLVAQVCDLLTRHRGVSTSGVNGAELAREVRQYLEQDPDLPTSSQARAGPKAEVGSTNPAVVADERALFPPNKPMVPERLTSPRTPAKIA